MRKLFELASLSGSGGVLWRILRLNGPTMRWLTGVQQRRNGTPPIDCRNLTENKQPKRHWKKDENWAADPNWPLKCCAKFIFTLVHPQNAAECVCGAGKCPGISWNIPTICQQKPKSSTRTHFRAEEQDTDDGCGDDPGRQISGSAGRQTGRRQPSQIAGIRGLFWVCLFIPNSRNEFYDVILTSCGSSVKFVPGSRNKVMNAWWNPVKIHSKNRTHPRR